MIVKIEIDKLIYYGRHYKDVSSTNNWWLGISDYQIYSTEQITVGFSYIDEESIKLSGSFIPFFQVDVIELEKLFLSTYSSKTLQKRLEKCLNSSNNDFDKAFKIMIETEEGLLTSWHEFEKKSLRKAAVEWCKKNRIKYQ